MRSVSFVKLAVLFAPLAFAAPGLASPTNLGFEEATLNGWTTNGGVAFVTPVLTNQNTGFLAAKEGVLFGVVTAGLGTDVYTTLSQSFTLQAGDTLGGYTGFLANDAMPFDDSAYLSINGINLWSWSVADVGAYGTSGWKHFHFVAPSAGIYTLQLGVANHVDNIGSSQAVIDGVQLNGAVPEPASWAMMVSGFGLAGLALRLRVRKPTFA